MRFVLLHYHILKNAGSTVEEILYQNFRDRLLRYDIPNRDEEVTQAHLVSLLEEHPEVSAFSSHQIYYPVPQAPGFLFFPLCFLRDPLDRIRSIYDYFRDKPSEGDPISELAARVGLGEFTGHLVREYPWMVNDVQVNMLSNGLVNDQPKGLEDLERATERMLATSFLGVVDCFNKSLIAGQHSLRTIFPNLDCGQAPVNVSGGMGSSVAARIEKFRAACDTSTWSELVRMNQMDQELLNRARAEIDRRFQQIGDGEKKLYALSHRIQQLETHRAATEGSGSTLPDSPPLPQPRTLLEKARRLAPAIPHLRALRHVFDTEFYLAQNPDVKAAGANPLVHYLLHGAKEDRKPHPLFEPNYYFNQCPEARAAGVNPLIHFLESKPGAWCNPHMLFDCAAYVRANRDATRTNPLLHHQLNSRPQPAHPDLQLEIDDVSVPVLFRAPQEHEPRGRTVFLWQDPAGKTHHSTPPEQEPFFEVVNYDQIAAQRAGTMVVRAGEIVSR
jgi:hypothetical protein